MLELYNSYIFIRERQRERVNYINYLDLALLI